jgi:hypothetical protein
MKNPFDDENSDFLALIIPKAGIRCGAPSPTFRPAGKLSPGKPPETLV